MKGIKIPSNIDVVIIEKEIQELFPTINKKKKNLSKVFTERILILFNEMRKSMIQNEQLFLKNRLSKESIPNVQLCKGKRLKIFPKSSDSIYSKSIQENVMSNYVSITKYPHDEYGEVNYYVTGKLCCQYYFNTTPEEFKDYTLITNEAISILNTIKKIEQTHVRLTDEQNQVRQQLMRNTEQIQIVSTESSISVLEDHLKQLKTTPKKFVESFNNNESRCITDSFGYRLHHKLTSLKKSLKNFLIIENQEEIMELDFANSQPYFASIISKDLLLSLSKESSYIKELLPLIPVVEKYQKQEDFKSYKRLCFSGELYEFLMKKHEQEYGELMNRSVLKTCVFETYFSDFSKHQYCKDKNKSRVIELIEKHFPSQYNMFLEIQQIDLKLKVLEHPKRGQESIKNTPLLLQRVESAVIFLIFSKVVKENIWCSSIHDSFVLANRPCEIKRVEDIVVNTFYELGVVPPKIKRK